MNYGTIKFHDVADGPGIRTTLFVSGCLRHCKGCFQPETWDFNYGKKFTSETEDTIIDSLHKTYVDGLTILGGEPFEPDNQRVLVGFLRRVREIFPDLSIWIYSGFTWEELTGRIPERCRCEVTDEMLSYIDILVDGRFIESKKNLTLMFRGSENQRIIDLKKSEKEGSPVSWSGLNDRCSLNKA